MMMPKDENLDIRGNDSLAREFVRLLSINQVRIYAYIISMTGHIADADDVMQEASVIMWQKFPEFVRGTDFLSWGISIAYFKIKEFRRSRGIKEVQISPELFEILHQKAPNKTENISLYIDKLTECLKKLNPNDYQLIQLRYMSGHTVHNLSKCMDRTVQSLYTRLSKIHGILSRCIKHSISQLMT